MFFFSAHKKQNEASYDETNVRLNFKELIISL